jgi:hypothetical protein
MKRILLLSFSVINAVMALGQELSAAKLVDMLSLPLSKMESQLLHKKYQYAGIELSGDTAFNTYQPKPPGKKKEPEKIMRRLTRAVLKNTFTLTYYTTSPDEYKDLLGELKKKGFYCEYENDKTVSPASYLYQMGIYTADASSKKIHDTTWYALKFFKKILPNAADLKFGDDLLQFTSHEYLVNYFGANNVKKDLYYFGGDDIVKCSVLFMNSNRQVIFIWNDGLNYRKIQNLLLGGKHKLKSQVVNAKFIADNNWWLKSGIRAGMPLFDLRTINKKSITFCGGDAPNPGLVLPESSGRIDFKSKDVILGCMNCNDEKYLTTKVMSADKAMGEGRNFFILTIVLYPADNGVFE